MIGVYLVNNIGCWKEKIQPRFSGTLISNLILCEWLGFKVMDCTLTPINGFKLAYVCKSQRTVAPLHLKTRLM